MTGGENIENELQAEQAETPNPFDLFKEESEYSAVNQDDTLADERTNTAEEAEQEVAELEKETEAVEKPIEKAQEPIKFANKESEKLYNYFIQGKLDEGIAIYNEQKKLAEVDKLAPEEIIRLNLKYENPEFDADDIEAALNDKYEKPEAPEQGMSELDDEFEERVAKYQKEVAKIDARIARDSKVAAKELTALQSKIELPDLASNNVSKEPTQEELEAAKEIFESYKKSVDTVLESLTGYDATYKDEEVNIPVKYNLSSEDKENVQTNLLLAQTDAGAFLQKIGWLDDKGQIAIDKLSKDLPFVLSRDKVLQGLINEVGSMTKAETIEMKTKQLKNIDYTGGSKTTNGTGISHQQAAEQFANAMFSA